MSVDVHTDIFIKATPAAVSSFAANPDNAPTWYDKIASVRWETEPPAALGSRMTFVAHFLGRRLEYTYEIVVLEPARKMVMRTAQGPFPMETTYTWEPEADGTRMGLRNRGEPRGFSKLMAPLMAKAMRGANRKDLEKLKRLLEAD